MAENMPAANAQRPGDVITTLSGKTIEVLNTDAEGRLVLSDGLWKAGTDYDPEYIVDFATLTGACVVALGHEATGLWSNDDDFRTRIHEAGNDVGELAWPMPLLPAFEKEMTEILIEAEAAMQKNVTERWKADLEHGNWLTRSVRPLVLIFLIVATVLMVFIDSGSINFNVEEKWTDLLQLVLMTTIGAYFGGRSVEKYSKKNNGN